jgi:hypothetical protein
MTKDPIEQIMEIAEGTDFIETVENVLRRLYEAAPVYPNDPAAKTLLHSLKLAKDAKAAGFRVIVGISRPCVKLDPKDLSVNIPLPFGPAMYATVLHEFGHVFGPGQATISELHDRLTKETAETSISYEDPRFPPVAAAIIEAEIGAWAWAFDAAELWSPEMGQFAAQALCSYIGTAIKAPAMPEGFFPMIEKLARGK